MLISKLHPTFWADLCSQSSHHKFLNTKCLVYRRIPTKKVEMTTKRTTTAIKGVSREGGLLKSGVTPLGGLAAGLCMYCSIVWAESPLNAMLIDDRANSGEEPSKRVKEGKGHCVVGEHGAFLDFTVGEDLVPKEPR